MPSSLRLAPEEMLMRSELHLHDDGAHIATAPGRTENLDSDLRLQFLSWLPDMFALVGTALQSDVAKEDSRKAAVAHEGDAAIEIFSLLPVGLK